MLNEYLKNKKYTELTELLIEEKQINSWMDGKTIIHHMAYDLLLYKQKSLEIYYNKLKPDEKDQILSSLASLYKLDKKKIEENFYTLNEAAFYKMLPLFQLLIENGCDVNKKDGDGKTIFDIFYPLECLKTDVELTKSKKNSIKK